MTGSGAATFEVLVSRDRLAARTTELGGELARRYARSAKPPVLVGALKGSVMFLADLVRATSVDCSVDFISISSYPGRGVHSGVVRIEKDLETDVTDRDVLIVEDIVDTGLTLNYLRRTIGERRPRSLTAVTLLDKAARRIVPVALEHRAFTIPDVFVVGYGLDYMGRYRNVPDVVAVRDIARLAADPDLLVEPLFAPSEAF